MAKLLAGCVAVISIVFIGGCQSSYVSQPSSPLQVVTKADLTPNVNVGDKIEATATVHKLFGLFSWGPGKFAEGVNYCTNLRECPVSSSVFGNTINEAKAAAAYKACTENHADFIVCPRYFIITDNYFLYKKTKAKVFGYKGVLTGVDKAVPPTPSPVVHSIEITKPIQLQPIKIVRPERKIHPKPAPAPLPDSSEK